MRVRDEPYHRPRASRAVTERSPLTRKNALFADADGGAEHWAVIASVIETCKLIGVEPYAFLADVIARIAGGLSQSRLDELLPWAYPATPDLKAVGWEQRLHRGRRLPD
jgi:hypothetical protein